jgi:predicted nucleotidyltransferase component of viral defense system
MSMLLNRSLVEEVALVKNISEEFIEKDWYVTQVIKLLAEYKYLDFAIIFTGGTALSKAHKIIQRFSEDIDFRVIAPSLGTVTGTPLKKALSTFKKSVVQLLQKHFTVKTIDAKDNNKHVVIELEYSTSYNPAEALRPYIKLELTYTNLLLPSIPLSVSSFINEVTKQAPEIESISCIDPRENAADKLSALTWRIPSRVRDENDKQPDLVRHLHDLAILSKHVVETQEFISLARATIDKDSNRSAVIAGMGRSEKISRMMEIFETDANYQKEYETFVNGMSYAQDAFVPTFEQAREALKRLIEKVK